MQCVVEGCDAAPVDCMKFTAAAAAAAAAASGTWTRAVTVWSKASCTHACWQHWARPACACRGMQQQQQQQQHYLFGLLLLLQR
jgi:hypothetical protein